MMEITANDVEGLFGNQDPREFLQLVLDEHPDWDWEDVAIDYWQHLNSEQARCGACELPKREYKLLRAILERAAKEQ